MKIFDARINEEKLAPLHYDVWSKSILPSEGVKGLKVSVSHLCKGGWSDYHIHEGSYQIYYVLKGSIMIITKSEKRILEEGMTAVIFPGELHRNAGINNESADYLVLTYEQSESK